MRFRKSAEMRKRAMHCKEHGECFSVKIVLVITGR
jgi:hypothetical protein